MNTPIPPLAIKNIPIKKLKTRSEHGSPRIHAQRRRDSAVVFWWDLGKKNKERERERDKQKQKK